MSHRCVISVPDSNIILQLTVFEFRPSCYKYAKRPKMILILQAQIYSIFILLVSTSVTGSQMSVHFEIEDDVKG